MRVKLNGVRVYKSVKNAERRANEVVDEGTEYFIAVVDENAYCIIVRLHSDKIYQARSYAEAGCYVIG